MRPDYMRRPAKELNAQCERRRYNARPRDLEDRINDACRHGPMTIFQLRWTLRVAKTHIEDTVQEMVARGELLMVDWYTPRTNDRTAYLAARTPVSE